MACEVCVEVCSPGLFCGGRLSHDEHKLSFHLRLAFAVSSQAMACEPEAWLMSHVTKNVPHCYRWPLIHLGKGLDALASLGQMMRAYPIYAYQTPIKVGRQKLRGLPSC